MVITAHFNEANRRYYCCCGSCHTQSVSTVFTVFFLILTSISLLLTSHFAKFQVKEQYVIPSNIIRGPYLVISFIALLGLKKRSPCALIPLAICDCLLALAFMFLGVAFVVLANQAYNSSTSSMREHILYGVCPIIAICFALKLKFLCQTIKYFQESNKAYKYQASGPNTSVYI